MRNVVVSFVLILTLGAGLPAQAQVRINVNVANVLSAIAAQSASGTSSSSNTKSGSGTSSYDQSLTAKTFRGLSKDLRLEVQLKLKNMGFYTSSLDGAWGPGTRGAVEQYAREADKLSMLVSEAGVTEVFRLIVEGISPVEAREAADAGLNVSANDTDAQAAKSNTDPLISSAEARVLIQRNELYARMLEYYQDQIENSDVELDAADLKLLNRKVELMSKEYSDMEANLLQSTGAKDYKYLTNIYPEMTEWRTSGFKLTEVFPRVPFFVRGTKEIGETFLRPFVTDIGALVYQLDFIDPDAQSISLRDSFTISTEHVGDFLEALHTTQRWADIARERGLARAYEKSAICFPEVDCASKVQGNTSVEVVFVLDQNGFSNIRLVRNKGSFSEDYSFSMESGLLLACYIEYMVQVGESEFLAGSISDEELDDLFQ